MTCAAVVLAAGTSSRMGAKNKLTAELGGRPLVARVVEALAAGGAAPIALVTGHEGDRVGAAVAGLGVERVDNPDFARGMGTSIAAGIRQLRGRATAALIALGDMPRVAPETVAALIAEHRRHPDVAIAPTHAGRRGHPVLFPASAFDALAALDGARGARSVFAAVRHAVIEVGDRHVADDIDTPEQLDAARRES